MSFNFLQDWIREIYSKLPRGEKLSEEDSEALTSPTFKHKNHFLFSLYPLEHFQTVNWFNSHFVAIEKFNLRFVPEFSLSHCLSWKLVISFSTFSKIYIFLLTV